MSSSGALGRVDLVRTDVSEERIAFIIRITRIGDLVLRIVVRLIVTAKVVPSTLILVILMMKAMRSSETSVLTRSTWCNIPEVGIFLTLVVFHNVYFRQV
jgi:hypothetical protein